MATIGLSRPYVALYTNNGGNVTYSRGMRFGRAIEYASEIETSDGNDLYADNVIGESASGIFTGGTLTMTTAELQAAVSRFILGLKTNTVVVDGKTIIETIFDEDSGAPPLGFGVIEKDQTYGKTTYTAIVLTKVQFNTPSRSITTQGEEIDWQTRETSATIMRDDTPKHQWQIYAENLESEELADKYIRYKLNMPIIDIGELAIITAAGSQEGYTSVTVTPALEAGNKYMYMLGSNLPTPYYDQSTGEEEGYTAWDGTSEIDAAGAQQILVVEVSADENARKFGISAINTEVIEG